MRTLLASIDLRTILLIPALLGDLVFRLLWFGIGLRKWTDWFRGGTGENKASHFSSK